MSDNYKVLIIDDEKLGRDIVRNYLKKQNNVEIIGECSNGFEGIKSINELKPDLIFLDIQMPKINGFEMLELLDHKPAIIFATAFDHYAIKAFEVNATDYLLKPFTEKRLVEAVEKAISRIKSETENNTEFDKLLKHVNESEEKLDRIVVKSNNKIVIIPIEKINYLEAQDDYVMIYSTLGKFLKQQTMKYFERHLKSEDFSRVHRSYIVKLDQIKQIDLFEKESYKITLIDGSTVPVSKSGYSRLKDQLK